MDENQMPLTAKQYNELYCKAFARLDEIGRMAERAMEELEELQLSMGDRAAEGRSAPAVPRRAPCCPFPGGRGRRGRENFSNPVLFSLQGGEFMI